MATMSERTMQRVGFTGRLSQLCVPPPPLWDMEHIEGDDDCSAATTKNGSCGNDKLRWGELNEDDNGESASFLPPSPRSPSLAAISWLIASVGGDSDDRKAASSSSLSTTTTTTHPQSMVAEDSPAIVAAVGCRPAAICITSPTIENTSNRNAFFAPHAPRPNHSSHPLPRLPQYGWLSPCGACGLPTAAGDNKGTTQCGPCEARKRKREAEQCKMMEC